MEAGSIVTLVGLVLGGGGIAAGVVALIKVRPEAGQVVVTAAQGALVVQSGVIDELKEELVRVHGELNRERDKSNRYYQRLETLERDVRRSEEIRDKLDTLAGKVYALSAELEKVQRERDGLMERNIQLQERIEELEAEVGRLKEANGR